MVSWRGSVLPRKSALLFNFECPIIVAQGMAGRVGPQEAGFKELSSEFFSTNGVCLESQIGEESRRQRGEIKEKATGRGQKRQVSAVADGPRDAGLYAEILSTAS